MCAIEGCVLNVFDCHLHLSFLQLCIVYHFAVSAML